MGAGGRKQEREKKNQNQREENFVKSRASILRRKIVIRNILNYN